MVPELRVVSDPDYDLTRLRSWRHDVRLGRNVRINPVHRLDDVEIGDWSYLSDDATVSHTTIGKFCSIGPDFLCGWGAHPVDGISTSPVFYSSRARYSLSPDDKFEEHARITIGNDVFIGARVTVLEGVTIGDGAVIGAGAVVSKDIPPYAVAVGCPVKVLRYRFDERTVGRLGRLRWWDFDEEGLQDVERMFWDVDAFVEKYG